MIQYMCLESQQPHPICTVKGLHYADLTDASWTSDGQTLSISSTDGYISFIQFEDGFFGTSVSRTGELPTAIVMYSFSTTY